MPEQKMPERGWSGTMSQVLHYLRTVGADCDEENKFIVEGEVVSFLGLGGENADVVVPPNARYFINGQPKALAAGLGTTSYGIRPIVII